MGWYAFGTHSSNTSVIEKDGMQQMHTLVLTCETETNLGALLNTLKEESAQLALERKGVGVLLTERK